MNKSSEPLLLLININYYFCIKFEKSLFVSIRETSTINKFLTYVNLICIAKTNYYLKIFPSLKK